MREHSSGDRRNSGRNRDSGEKRDFGSRGSFGERRSFGGPQEMHKAVCAECGKECEVPFKPTEGRPVYCKECFRKRRSF